MPRLKGPTQGPGRPSVAKIETMQVTESCFGNSYQHRAYLHMSAQIKSDTLEICYPHCVTHFVSFHSLFRDSGVRQWHCEHVYLFQCVKTLLAQSLIETASFWTLAKILPKFLLNLRSKNCTCWLSRTSSESRHQREQLHCWLPRTPAIFAWTLGIWRK